MKNTRVRSPCGRSSFFPVNTTLQNEECTVTTHWQHWQPVQPVMKRPDIDAFKKRKPTKKFGAPIQTKR